MRPRTRARSVALVLVLALTPAGFAMKLYGTRFIANNLSGAAYEVFWCLFVFLIVPSRRASSWIAAGVLIITCALEFVQLIEHPALEAIRGNFIGRTVIGNAFAWRDFPYYFLGSAMGWGLMRTIAPREDSGSGRR